MIDYKSIISRLKFDVEKTLREDLERGQFILVGSYNGTKSILKITSISNPVKAKNLEKEYIVTSAIFDNTVFGRTLFFDKNENYVCYVREYIQGHPLSAYNQDSSVVLYRYDILDKKVCVDKEKIINGITHSLDIIHEETYRKALMLSPRDYFGQRWNMDIKQYNVSSIEKGLKHSLKDQVDFYYKNFNSYKENYSCCVGDLNPANILFDGKDVRLVDLEWFSIDNSMLDISFLWLFLWRYPDWQELLLRNVASEREKDDFRASVIRQIIAWFDVVFDPDKKVTKDNIEEYKAHIWARYVKAAGESFEALTNTK